MSEKALIDSSFGSCGGPRSTVSAVAIFLYLLHRHDRVWKTNIFSSPRKFREDNCRMLCVSGIKEGVTSSYVILSHKGEPVYLNLDS
jgi:hypothetical protein